MVLVPFHESKCKVYLFKMINYIILERKMHTIVVLIHLGDFLIIAILQESILLNLYILVTYQIRTTYHDDINDVKFDILKIDVRRGVVFKILHNEVDTIDILDFERLPHFKGQRGSCDWRLWSYHLLTSGH